MKNNFIWCKYIAAINEFGQSLRRVVSLYGGKARLLPNDQTPSIWIVKYDGEVSPAFVIVEYCGDVFEIGCRYKTPDPIEAISYVQASLNEICLQD